MIKMRNVLSTPSICFGETEREREREREFMGLSFFHVTCLVLLPFFKGEWTMRIADLTRHSAMVMALLRRGLMY